MKLTVDPCFDRVYRFLQSRWGTTELHILSFSRSSGAEGPPELGSSRGTWNLGDPGLDGPTGLSGHPASVANLILPLPLCPPDASTSFRWWRSTLEFIKSHSKLCFSVKVKIQFCSFRTDFFDRPVWFFLFQAFLWSSYMIYWIHIFLRWSCVIFSISSISSMVLHDLLNCMYSSISSICSMVLCDFFSISGISSMVLHDLLNFMYFFDVSYMISSRYYIHFFDGLAWLILHISCISSMVFARFLLFHVFLLWFCMIHSISCISSMVFVRFLLFHVYLRWFCMIHSISCISPMVLHDLFYFMHSFDGHIGCSISSISSMGLHNLFYFEHYCDGFAWLVLCHATHRCVYNPCSPSCICTMVCGMIDDARACSSVVPSHFDWHQPNKSFLSSLHAHHAITNIT